MAPASPTPAEASEAVAARINGEAFTLAELERELAISRVAYQLTNQRELVLQDLAGTLQGLLPSLILDQQARQAGLVASDEEINAALQSYAAGRNTTPEGLAEALSRYGYGLADLRVSLARTVRIEKFLNDLMSDPEQAPPDLQEWLLELRRQAEIEILYQPPAESPLLGGAAPDFSLANLDGTTISLAHYQGRPIILNFWATWCGPCREEMPLFERAYQNHQAEGLVVLAVNFEEEINLIHPYVAELGLTFEILSDRQAEVTKSYGITGLPATFFIDRQGIIQHVQLGPVHEDLLEKMLNLLVNTD